MAGLLYRLGRLSARRHWTVIVSWALIIALAGVGYGLFHGAISSAITIPGTATSKVTDELATKFPKASGGSGSIVFATTDGSALSDGQKSDVTARGSMVPESLTLWLELSARTTSCTSPIVQPKVFAAATVVTTSIGWSPGMAGARAGQVPAVSLASECNAGYASNDIR